MASETRSDSGQHVYARIGIPGLDDILGGGLTPSRLYLVEGVPGSGKTTLAMQFLLEGAKQGEPVLYFTLSETATEIRQVALSHGWSLDGIAIHELMPNEDALHPDHQLTMFHPSEIELTETTKSVLAEVERLKPRRVVFDSLSELRLLAGSPLRYRRQILALKQFFSGRSCTVMLLDDMTSSDHDLQVQSIAHGVILLEQLNPDYGADRRRLRIVKYRGVEFRSGFHDYVIYRGGLTVFPRLVAAEHRQAAIRGAISSGIPELDSLTGGGIERGTSTLIVGPAGGGKSTVAAQYCASAVKQGLKASMFIFDETIATLVARAAGLGIDLQAALDSGSLNIQQIDPAELSPGEFAYAIRASVDEHDSSVVVIDSLNGYLLAMPAERFLAIQLHELLTYLGQRGVATLLIAAHQGIIGSQMSTPIDASYLADSVLLLRFFEALGEVRQAISMVKKRSGAHERTIREFEMKDGKIRIGDALREFRGVLTGVPTYDGTSKRLTEGMNS